MNPRNAPCPRPATGPLILMTAVLLAACLLAPRPAHASPVQAPKRVEAVFVGDRLVDIAYNLGFVARGMSLRCSLWPACKELRNASQVLGCPRCIVKKTPRALPDFMRANGIKRLIIEKSPNFCIYAPDISPTNAAALVEGMDVDIRYVDFSRGLPEAIRQTAELLGVPDKGKELTAGYEKAYADAVAAIPQGGLGKRVVVLNGTFQPSTGKTFLRVEAPGGYADQYILAPLGCENVGAGLYKQGATVSKGHVLVRGLKGLAQTRPDVIVMTGDPLGVQQALARAVEEHPELAEVPAVRDMAVYTLPRTRIPGSSNIPTCSCAGCGPWTARAADIPARARIKKAPGLHPGPVQAGRQA